jgi:L-lactate dehydrogenase complex protein LldG
MSRREEFYAKLKSSLAGDKRAPGEREAAVAARLKSPPAHLKISRVSKTGEERRAQFKAYLEGQSARVIEVSDRTGVPAAVASYLRETNLPQRIRMGGDGYLAALPWSSVPALERASGAATPTDEASLSHAVAGVSETGTLVLTSGSDNPVTLTFLPETSIVVVEERDLVGGYEDVWPRIAEKFGAGRMPRTVNFVSGPSRTGDIGGKLVMGAHGPRRLCVIVVKV